MENIEHIEGETLRAAVEDATLALARGQVVLVGPFTVAEQRALYLSIDQGARDITFVRTPREFRERLTATENPHPRCVLVDMNAEGAVQLIHWMRGDVRLYAVPIIALVDGMDGKLFENAYAAGADDVVCRHRMGAVARRVDISLRAHSTPTMRAPAYSALIVSPNIDKRRVLGRALRVAGYSPSFALTLESAVDELATSQRDLVVVHTDTGGGTGWNIVESLRAATRADLPVIIVSESQGKDVRLTTKYRAAHVNEDAPADDVIFVANEIIRPVQSRARGSTRLLFGTTCTFRVDGQIHAEQGFTYNVSRGGLYVRTTDAPEVGTKLHLELTPPYATEPVTLVGHVKWVRSFGDGHGGPVPTGFGVEFCVDECDPLARASYEMAYSVLARVNHTPEDDSAWNGEYDLVQDCDIEVIA